MPGHAVHLENHAMIGLSFHDGLRIFPLPPMPQKFVYLEFFPRLRGWDNWQSLLSKRVLGPGRNQLIGKSSDIGILIPHIPIIFPPFCDLFWPLTLLMSSSVSMMSSSSVVVESQSQWSGDTVSPVAVCTWPCAPFSQNVGCSDPIGLPTDFVISPDSISVGITCADVLRAVGEYAIQAAFSLLANAGGKRAAKRFKKTKLFTNRKGKKIAKKADVAGQKTYGKTFKSRLKKIKKANPDLTDVDAADMAETAANVARKETRETTQKQLEKQADRVEAIQKHTKWSRKDPAKPFRINKLADETYDDGWKWGTKPMIDSTDSLRNRMGKNWDAFKAGGPWVTEAVQPKLIKAIAGGLVIKMGIYRLGVKRGVNALRKDYYVWRGNLTPDPELQQLGMETEGEAPQLRSEVFEGLFGPST